MKQQLLKEPPASTTPEAEAPYASTPRENASQLTDIMSSINEAVEKYTEELLSDALDLPPEMSTFMQVRPLPTLLWPSMHCHCVCSPPA
jgi:hypothetical protein